jgi:hypothetical protein
MSATTGLTCTYTDAAPGAALRGDDNAVIAPAVVLDRTAGAHDEFIAVLSRGRDFAVPAKCPWVTAERFS